MNYPIPVALEAGHFGVAFGANGVGALGIKEQLFFQKFDGLGAPVWPGAGVALTAGPTVTQIATRAAISDGSGGAFVAWNDTRGAASDSDYPLYLTHITGDGSLPWGVGGQLIRQTGFAEFVGGMLPDGAGGVFITWGDGRPLPVGGGFAQHIDATGAFLWPDTGAVIQLDSQIVGEGPERGILGDGDGGIYVSGQRAWTDDLGRARSSARLNHLLTNGTRDPAWPDTGLAFSASAPVTRNFQTFLLPGAGSDILMAWNGVGNLARIRPDGSVVWRYAGNLPAGYPWIPDGHGGVFLAFSKGLWQAGLPAQTLDLYAHHVSADGAMLSGTGIPLSIAPGAQYGGGSISDCAGGMISVWSDSRQDPAQFRGPTRIFGQNINHDGTLGGSIVAAQVALVAFDALPALVRLRWSAPSLTPVYTLERRQSDGLWRTMSAAQLSVSGTDEVDAIDNDVIPGATYVYRLTWDASGQPQHSAEATVTVPFEPALRLAVVGQPRSDGSAVVSFSLPLDVGVRLRMFDISGRLVRTLVDGATTAGTHTIRWDGTDDSGRSLASGLFVVRLDTARWTLSTRVLLMR